MQNASERNLVLNSLQEGNADDLPQLGRVFLSSAYLFVNQDANKFTLWAANPTMHEDLVAVDSNNAVINEFCSPAPSTTPTPHHPSSPKADNDTPQLKLPLAAIVGIVIGVVVGIGIFLCIGVRFKRAGKKKPKPQFPTSVVTEDPKPKAHSEYVPWELDGRHVVFPPPEPQELPAGSPYVGWAPVHSSRQAENKTSSQPAMF